MISCLMPTYNRLDKNPELLDEAVECFLRQTNTDSELIICSDAPGQRLVFEHPRVRIFNMPYRFPYLSEKIQFMIDKCQGEYICRWDDDDIHLPHRLELSLRRLKETGRLEWSCDNYWVMSGGRTYEQKNPVNVHVTAIWHHDLLDIFPGHRYPTQRKGDEDVQVNGILRRAGLLNPEMLPLDQMYYVYRWGVSATHLSSRKSMGQFYDDLGKRPVKRVVHTISPRWRVDYSESLKKFLSY